MDELRRIRHLRGMSQEDLAKVSGVSDFTISELEGGKRPNPRPSTLRKLANALGVDVATLYGEEVPSPKGDAPLSFSRWLEERCGHSYLAMPEEELIELLTDAEAVEKERISRAVQAEFMATVKTKDLPSEERLLARGHHKEATNKWLSVLVASGSLERVTEEAERSIKEVLEAAADEETA